MTPTGVSIMPNHIHGIIELIVPPLWGQVSNLPLRVADPAGYNGGVAGISPVVFPLACII